MALLVMLPIYDTYIYTGVLYKVSDPAQLKHIDDINKKKLNNNNLFIKLNKHDDPNNPNNHERNNPLTCEFMVPFLQFSDPSPLSPVESDPVDTNNPDNNPGIGLFQQYLRVWPNNPNNPNNPDNPDNPDS